MTNKDKEKKKEYNRAYYQAHREDHKEYMKNWYQAHKAERKAYREAHRDEKKAYNKAYREAHRDEKKAYREAHKDEQKAYMKAWNQAHKDEKKAYSKSDTNSLGHTKDSIRVKSNRYLFNVLKHTKLPGYEIHHCFGYDDYRNFIYIPKELHLQIHQYLRDNGIDADTDHYSKIAHLVVGWDGYVYIKD